MIANQHADKAQKKNRSPIAKLPRGVAVFQTVNGNGREYWRVRLNKKIHRGQGFEEELFHAGCRSVVDLW